MSLFVLNIHLFMACQLSCESCARPFCFCGGQKTRDVQKVRVVKWPEGQIAPSDFLRFKVLLVATLVKEEERERDKKHTCYVDHRVVRCHDMSKREGGQKHFILTRAVLMTSHLICKLHPQTYSIREPPSLLMWSQINLRA